MQVLHPLDRPGTPTMLLTDCNWWCCGTTCGVDGSLVFTRTRMARFSLPLWD